MHAQIPIVRRRVSLEPVLEASTTDQQVKQTPLLDADGRAKGVTAAKKDV